MDRVDFEFEEFLISETIRAALHRPNLVVRALQGRNGQVAIILKYTHSHAAPRRGITNLWPGSVLLSEDF